MRRIWGETRILERARAHHADGNCGDDATLRKNDGDECVGVSWAGLG